MKKISDQQVKAQSIKSVQANIAETAKKNLQWIILNTWTQCYTGEYKSYNFYSESYWRPELNVELWGILNTDDKFCSCAKY